MFCYLIYFFKITKKCNVCQYIAVARWFYKRQFCLAFVCFYVCLCVCNVFLVRVVHLLLLSVVRQRRMLCLVLIGLLQSDSSCCLYVLSVFFNLCLCLLWCSLSV